MTTLVALFALGLAGPAGHGSDRPAVPKVRPAARPYFNLPDNDAANPPALLSLTGAFADVQALTPSPSLIPYNVILPFWSDGAEKRRWIAVPKPQEGGGATIRFATEGEWTFPAGTVFVKHFEMGTDEVGATERRRIETRLLVRLASGGVRGFSYRWRPDGSDADLVLAPRVESMSLGTASGPKLQFWHYPGPDDCRRCHTPASGGVLGVNARQLNRDVAGPAGSAENQLNAWDRLGLFDPRPARADIPRMGRLARLDDAGRSLEDRARSFLDANCSHCHRPGGAAADFDARYDTPLAHQGLIRMPPRINLGIDGARFIAPNDPWRSTLLARVETLEPTKMPPLAHEVADRQGIAVLRAWIQSLPGPTVAAPPTISPASGDFRSPVRVVLRHDDPNAVIRYTVDGTSPGKTSPRYAGPFEVRRSTTVRARAYKAGQTRSVEVQETLIIDE